MTKQMPIQHELKQPEDPKGLSAGLAFLLIVLCFLPYMALGPLKAPSQVQPWAALAGWLFVIFKVLTSKLRITGQQLIVLALSLWFVIYVDTTRELDIAAYIRRSSSFFLSCGIMFAAQYVRPETVWKASKIVLPLWLMFALLGYVAPSLYFSLVQPFVPTVVGVAGGRGTTSLAPEATDFGFTMAAIFVILLTTRAVLLRRNAAVSPWPLWLAVINLALSKSGSGFAALLIIGAVHVIVVSSKKALGQFFGFSALIVTTLVMIALAANLESTGTRGLDLIIQALQSPSTLIDTTLSYRIAHNVVGVIGLWESNLIGYGAGAFLQQGQELYWAHNVGTMLGLSGWYAQNVPVTFTQSPVSSLAVVILEYGLFGVLFLVISHAMIFRSNLPHRQICVTIFFLTWIQSFPIAYPLSWLLLGLATNPSFLLATGLSDSNQDQSLSRGLPPKPA